MSSKENAKPVNIDPRCIQEALRMYFQPIKSDDPQLDFYTMYKRETMEYDTEYMQKHNEDLNTTLIFAGLFSAVSSAFVIDVQSKLQPDPSERSEAYLRAILLSLNRSISPDEEPAAPPAWGGPPKEIITTSDLLYASLLMSLLAAFVAMLGKQWLNRYLRHTGGSMIERCGDRQRKFDGLQKWPFRLFVEGLPIMLQIALLLLTCGLSRYMWSVNTSVARVVISFTALGILFYIGIVVAGTSSYECPFQTPASIALRHLRDSGMARKLLGSLSPINFISLIYIAWIYAQQGLISGSHRVYEIMWSPLSWQLSLSRVMSGIQNKARKVGHQTIILLLRIDRALGNTKHKLAQGIQRFRRTALLPITTKDVQGHPLVPQNGSGLLIRVWNLEALRRQNTDNARCVCWVLWNITDPEAIDSAIRLVGTIRWFDGNSDHNLPFGFIVSTFEACFDSTKKLYPGMRDRAYFSARAILQINLRARARSRDERVSNYTIPAIASSSFQHTDPDLHHIILMLELNSGSSRPTLDFPRVDTTTHTHSLWLSNLFVDLTYVGPNPILASYESYLSVAVANHQAMIANILLTWYMFLGGHVEEETFWAVDKSDSLEAILSHLSTRVTNVIADGNCPKYLDPLLEFLAAWEKRPAYLTPMAYQWCSAISEVAGRLSSSEVTVSYPAWLQIDPDLRVTFDPGLKLKLGASAVFAVYLGLLLGRGSLLQLRLQSRDPALNDFGNELSEIFEEVFLNAGPGCDPVRLDDSPHRTRGHPQHLTTHNYAHLFFMALEIGFRLVSPGRDPSALCFNHTPHHVQVFGITFLSEDDEVIADALCPWVAGIVLKPPGSWARHFAERVERPVQFSPRLRQMSIHVILRILRGELEVPGLETVYLLNRLEVDVDDVDDGFEWVKLLVSAIRSPTGLGSLSSHNWRLLGELVVAASPYGDFVSHDVKVMRSLEEVGDWEKLEVWMAVIWQSLSYFNMPESGPMQEIDQATLKLLLQRPSALPRFRGLCAGDRPLFVGEDALRRICDQALAEQLPSESPLPLQPIHVQPLVALPFARDDTF